MTGKATKFVLDLFAPPPHRDMPALALSVDSMKEEPAAEDAKCEWPRRDAMAAAVARSRRRGRIRIDDLEKCGQPAVTKITTTLVDGTVVEARNYCARCLSAKMARTLGAPPREPR